MATTALENLANISGAPRHVSKVLGIFGDAPSKTAIAPVASKTWQQRLEELKAKAGPDVEDGYGKGAIGAAAGAYLWNKHRYLGGLGGFSLGRNLPALINGGLDRRLALCNLATVAAAVLVSLYYPKHPAAAFVVGGLAAGTAIQVAGLRK